MFLHRLCLFLVLALAHPLLAVEPPVGPEKWEKEIAAFEAADRVKMPPAGGILFIGSSSIRLWKTLAEDFPGLPVINRGFGGSQIVDATHFIGRIVLPYRPRQIVFYSGGNDLNAGKSPEQVVADFKTFVTEVRRHLPEVRIAYISIAGNPARWAQVAKVKAVNTSLAAWLKEVPHADFIDVFRHMMGSDGTPKPEIFVEDKLHMNAAGYAIWKKVVGPYLAKE